MRAPRTAPLGAVIIMMVLVFSGGAGAAQTGRATLRTFAGDYAGHTRSLRISTAGVAHEAVDSGCCDRVLRLTFRLSHPRGTRSSATARVRVTKVVVLDPDAYSGSDLKPPKVGQTGTLRLRGGVIREPFTRTTYCTPAGDATGACGA